MNDKQLAALTEGHRLALAAYKHQVHRAGDVDVESIIEELADARLEVARLTVQLTEYNLDDLEDGVGWRWRIRNTVRGLGLERWQMGRRPFWEEVSLLAAYLPSAQDA